MTVIATITGPAPGQPGRPGHGPEKKFEVVSKWLSLGNLRTTAELCKIGYGTILKWRSEPWWKEMEEEVKAGRRAHVDGKLTNIVDRALDVVNDRLENGEFVLNQKTGEVIRKPVALKDATTAVSSLMQRQAVLEKQGKSHADQNVQKTIQETLKELAVQFAKFNKRNNAAAETIEFKEIKDDALHEEWEEGLQEGSGEVYEPPGSGEEEGTAERSPS